MCAILQAGGASNWHLAMKVPNPAGVRAVRRRLEDTIWKLRNTDWVLMCGPRARPGSWSTDVDRGIASGGVGVPMAVDHASRSAVPCVAEVDDEDEHDEMHAASAHLTPRLGVYHSALTAAA